MNAVYLVTGIVIGAVIGILAGYFFWKSKQAPPVPPSPPVDVGAIKDAVKTAASEAVQRNREETVQLAKDQIGPIVTAATTKISEAQTGIGNTVSSLSRYLESIGTALSTIETARQTSYTSLDERIKALIKSEENLQDSASRLSSAIRNPQAKGSWGETTLKRIAELSGMVEYCDFDTQVHITVDGEDRRPDMVITLPSNRVIIVDSKAPTSSYLSALEAKTPEESESLMKDHASKVKGYANTLSKKEYWREFSAGFGNSLELVVMYVPGESFLNAALQVDRDLVNRAMESNVIIATPTILLSLLKAIARGWSERKVEENAKKILEAGKELYDRAGKMTDFIEAWRESVEGAAEAYNSFVGSYEGRFLVQARKFNSLGLGRNDIQQLEGVDQQLRKVKAKEED